MLRIIAALLVVSAAIGFATTTSSHRPNPPSTEEDGTIPPRDFWESPRR